MLKRYIAFTFHDWDAPLGWDGALRDTEDQVLSWDTPEEAIPAVRSDLNRLETPRYAHIVDLHTGKEVEVDGLLNTELDGLDHSTHLRDRKRRKENAAQRR